MATTKKLIQAAAGVSTGSGSGGGGGGGGGGALSYSWANLDTTLLAATRQTATSTSITSGLGGFFVDPSGNNLFTFDSSTVRKFTMSTPHDVTTLSSQAASFAPTNPWPNRGLTFSHNGTEMFLTDESPRKTYRYTMNAWDISAVSGPSPSGGYLNSQINTEQYTTGIRFDPTGYKMLVYWYSAGPNLHSYTLTTAFDPSSRTLIGSSNYANTPVRNMDWSDDGTLLVYATGTTLQYYYLTTPWDVSTISSHTTVSNFVPFSITGVSITGPYLYLSGGNTVQRFNVPISSGGGGSATNVQDLFAAAQYTGNGTSAAATQDITTSVDLSSGTGMVMTKRTDGTAAWYVTDTVRGGSKEFAVTSDAESNTGLISSFNSDGYTLTGSGNTNTNVHEYLSYTFKNQDHFFKCFQYTGNGTTQQIAHGLGSTPGLILVKRSGYHWGFWHKEWTGTSNGGYFNINSPPAARLTWFNDNTNVVDPTSTHFTVGSSGQVNGNGHTYTAYVFGDNINGSGGFGSSGSEDIIKCGTYTGTGTTDGEEIDLGFQPQLFFFKNVTSSNLWHVFDAERGLTDVVTTNDPYLSFDNSNSQYTNSDIVKLITDGIKIVGSNHSRWNATNNKYIYVAIRKTMPTGSGSGSATPGLDVESVFSTYLYNGTGSTQTITNGIDLASEGGLVWFKQRNASRDHGLFDTERGANKYVIANDTNAEATSSTMLTAFNSNGFTLGNGGAIVNNGSGEYASWTFRKAPKFFTCVQYTGNGVAGRTISHDLGATVGSIFVKRTDSTRNWAVYHRSLGATKYLVLNETNAENTATSRWNDTEPTSTVFTVGSDIDTNVSGGTYIAYLFAHNDGDAEFGSDGAQDIIKCGSYTGNGSTDGPEIDLGFEPQWVMIKDASSSGNWTIYDAMRGWPVGREPQALFARSSSSEQSASWGKVDITSTGFKIQTTDGDFNQVGTYIYIAIRRPMAVPTDAADVFGMDQSDGTEPSFDAGFPVDFAIKRPYGTAYVLTQARLAETSRLTPTLSISERFDSSITWDHMEGWSSETSTTLYSWMWRRAPGYFDAVCFSGNGTAGRTVGHNLTVAPEMIWVKSRSDVQDWDVYHAGLNGGNDKGHYKITMNSTGAESNSATQWNDTAPSASNFTVGTSGTVNASGSTYIAYLFASVTNVSKCGSYTGNGSSQTIDCGFTSGARFILIKRTDGAGNWYFWDTDQGIIAGNSPHMALNNTDIQITTDDSIDPASSGFIVNQVSATDVNVSSATYIFYAIA